MSEKQAFTSTIPAGTDIEIGSLQLKLTADTVVEFSKAASYDQAAEQGAVAGLHLDWSHEETDERGKPVLVSYGQFGERLVSAIAKAETAEVVEVEVAEEPKKKGK